MTPDDFYGSLSVLLTVFSQIVEPLGPIVVLGAAGSVLGGFCVLFDGHFYPPYVHSQRGVDGGKPGVAEGLLGPNAAGFTGLKDLKAAEQAAAKKGKQDSQAKTEAKMVKALKNKF